MKNYVTVQELIEFAKLDILGGNNGVSNRIKVDEINYPWMEFAGYFTYFEPARLILISSKEAMYLNNLEPKLAYERVEYIFKQQPPAVVFSRNVNVPEFFIELGNRYNIPILKSDFRTTPLHSKLFGFLRERLAERKSVHGVLLDINGVGTLIIGKSGIGKSETALELIKRGHQLVADDRVDIYEKEVGILIGAAPEIIAQYLEVRGVGIINVIDMFGAGAYRETKKIFLVIEIEKWDENKTYDRLGLDNNCETYFHTDVPKITIPVLPGRNTAVLIEAAAMNAKLKYLGNNAALELTQKISRKARGEE